MSAHDQKMKVFCMGGVAVGALGGRGGGSLQEPGEQGEQITV